MNELENLDDNTSSIDVGEADAEDEYEEEEEIEDWFMEDLFHKNTSSFQCLAQIEISRSSLFREPLYFFPELEDPHLEEALWGIAERPVYDDIGVQRYRDLCKIEKIIPYRRVIKSLDEETLDLKFYALGEKAMKTICGTLQFNNYVQEFVLEENMMKPETVAHLGPLIENNKAILTLNLKQCQIGPPGAQQLAHSFAVTKTLLELDLSYNNLGDEGIEYLTEGLCENTSIKILNLSHNGLGDGSLNALKLVVEDNYVIQDLDLSWNYLYNPTGMKAFMEGLSENIGVHSLHLAWNGISDPDTFLPIVTYLKTESAKLQHLDLSNNRLTGPAIALLRPALKINENLVTLNLAFNSLTAAEVELVAGIFLIKRAVPAALSFINFGNTWVNKTFVRKLQRIRKKGCNVEIGGIYSNYVILGPNIKEMLLERAKFVALMPKSKKKKKDIGQFIVQFKDDLEPVRAEEFAGMLKKYKIKLDKDLLDMIAQTFAAEKRRIDLNEIKATYMKMYPDTKFVPPKKKPKRKRKKKAANK